MVHRRKRKVHVEHHHIYWLRWVVYTDSTLKPWSNDSSTVGPCCDMLLANKCISGNVLDWQEGRGRVFSNVGRESNFHPTCPNRVIKRFYMFNQQCMIFDQNVGTIWPGAQWSWSLKYKSKPSLTCCIYLHFIHSSHSFSNWTMYLFCHLWQNVVKSLLF